jgi:molybdopterin/thiamine biosynthesis adenylyltransferase
VGQITLIDDDTVDLTNLQRQIMHTTARVGQPKVDSARQAIEAINPGVQVHTVARRADAALLDALVPPPTWCWTAATTTPRATRSTPPACATASRWCRARPSASTARCRYDPRRADSPCYACVFPPTQTVPEVACATWAWRRWWAGGQPAGRRGHQAAGGIGQPLVGRLLMIDSRQAEFTTVRLRRQSDCPVCQPPPAAG